MRNPPPNIVPVTTRRALLAAGAGGAIGAVLGTRVCRAQTATTRRADAREFRLRSDLLHPQARGVEVIQLTANPEVPGSHIYMEAQIFTPDSRHFVLQRAGHAHGSDRKEPKHQFLRCDIDDRFSLHPLTDEIGTTGPSVSPDGRYLYYFVDETRPGSGRLTLKRVNIDGTDRRTLLVVDAALPDTRFRPSRIYPLSTISSDGKRIAISGFLGDGNTPGAPWGLMVFDIEKAAVQLVIQGQTWCNMHPQYCRSTDADERHDILIQENHDNQASEKGEITRLVGGQGADIHVIRDDGTNLRDLPWGRDGNEYCQGHQCWRGRTTWAITSTDTRQPREAGLIESRPVPHVGHIGCKLEGAVRNKLTRQHPAPKFYHFATDALGKWLVSDYAPFDTQGEIVLARFGRPGEDPLADYTPLARPGCTGQKTAHLHPFLSLNARMAFFNSDESGILQAYAIRGLTG